MTDSFRLAAPCGNCPFRTDKPFQGLSQNRKREIAYSSGLFHCHKTVDYSGDDGAKVIDRTQVCAGFLIMLESEECPNQMMRIAERIGMYDRRKLDMTAPVFQSREDFVEGWE